MGENEIKGIEDYSTLELLVKLEKSLNDAEWSMCWTELMQRTPFKELDKCFQDALENVSLLTDRVNALNETLKKHEHLHGSVVVKL